MSENCHPGIEYLLQLYAEEQSRVDTALTQKVHHVTVQEGMKGEPIPYQLRSDWMVTSVLFLCFILVSYVLAHGKKHLEQQFKNFSLSKRQPTETEGKVPQRIFLVRRELPSRRTVAENKYLSS